MSSTARTDTHAIRQRFLEVDTKYRQNLQSGMSTTTAMTNTPPMIPEDVATRGANNGTVRGEVISMIKCSGDRAGLNPGVTSELQGMYKDATNAKSGNFMNWLFGR